MTPATTSPTVALVTATAVAAAGIAYWSSASNTSAVGALILEIMRVTGTIEESETSDKKSVDNTNDEEKEKSDNSNNAFVSWLDKEEKENINFPRPWNNGGKKKNKDEDLTDPQWMSETIRNALLSTAMAALSAAVIETATARTVLIENESSASGVSTISSSAETEIIQETILSPISQLMDDEKETLCETAFRRSFRSLQKATEAMIRRKPHIREDFFNGVFVDEEMNDQREEDKKMERRLRSLSLSSVSSSSSYWSVSTGSYVGNRDDRLVEEEEEVERLLTYLRFVELAKEEALTSALSGSSKEKTNHTTGHIRRRSGEPLFPIFDGYELLRSATMETQDATDSRRAKVGYTAAVHQGRKELVIAVHYDGLPLSSSTIDNRNQIKTILMSSLFLQQEEHSATITAASPSSSFLLLDQAVTSLSEEILLRYLHTNNTREEPSFLSSGYSLVLCGHSLGAALACKLGDVLTQRNRATVSKSFQVRVCAFGPPPCLPSRQRFGQDGSNFGGEYSYITSVVNNHDCVPRWTESNLVGLRMSLRWTMDRKRRHFQKYNNRYNRYRPSTNNPVTAAADKTTPARRRPPRIPAFSMSSRDWNTFWKSNHEPNNNAFLPQQGDIIDEVGPKFIVPGKVVSVWNHSQDPTIIGAKVHLPETKHRHPSSSNCHAQLLQHHHKGNCDVLGRLWVAEGMFSDHTIEAYRSNLELLLGQLANTI